MITSANTEELLVHEQVKREHTSLAEETTENNHIYVRSLIGCLIIRSSPRSGALGNMRYSEVFDAKYIKDGEKW